MRFPDMKSFVVCVLLLSVYSAQGQMYGGDWMPNLLGNINRMTSDLNQNIMNMNQQIQENVRQSVNEMTENLQRTATAGGEGGPEISMGVNGGSLIVNSGPGVSRIVTSGYDADGEPYYRDSEDKVVGSTLYHTEKIYYPSRGTTNEFRYTLNLTDPNARPVIQTN